VRPNGSLWCYSRLGQDGDPPQGWKLHVSATVLSACAVFRRIAPYLRRRKASFKAARSLDVLNQLNAGNYYGFSQVGKFVTVYPTSGKEAVVLARALDRLTHGQPAPRVPYDEVLRPGSCIHYRYGAFDSKLRVRVGKTLVPALLRPDGTRAPDRREPLSAVPSWMANPFPGTTRPNGRVALTQLDTAYEGYEALVQRGRGGVYRALEKNSKPPRARILKEGRRHGETDWHGRDGYYRIQNEARFLRALSTVTRAVPRVLATFQANGSFYLVMEHIRGRTLQSVIASHERISRRRTLAYCLNMSQVVADIHSAGWAWADCKPANFLCVKDNRLRALDFEGAFKTTASFPLEMRTPGYVPPTRDRANPQSDDLFALGACFAQLVARKVHPPKRQPSLERRGPWLRLPSAFAKLTRDLMDPRASSRPSARAAEHLLKELLLMERTA
jgi:tRNA A-37 threonylcarbamoyl transferase component Bud32